MVWVADELIFMLGKESHTCSARIESLDKLTIYLRVMNCEAMRTREKAAWGGSNRFLAACCMLIASAKYQRSQLPVNTYRPRVHYRLAHCH